jgi:hypothetical protein
VAHVWVGSICVWECGRSLSRVCMLCCYKKICIVFECLLLFVRFVLFDASIFCRCNYVVCATSLHWVGGLDVSVMGGCVAMKCGEANLWVFA